MPHLHEATDRRLNSFEDLTTALVACVRRSWHTENLAPRGLNTVTGEVAPEYAEKPEFTGPVNICSRHLSFPESISASNVSRERDPLAVLVKASVTYGMDVEQERVKRGVENATKKLALTSERLLADANAPEEVKQLMDAYQAFMVVYLAEALRG